MADDAKYNFVGKEAKRQMKAVIADMKALKNRVNRLQATGPRGKAPTLWAELVSRIADNSWSATQVMPSTDGSFSPVPNGFSWGDESDSVGILYAVNSTQDLEGIYPVFWNSDGTYATWGFKVQEGDEFNHPFKGRINTDGTAAGIEVGYLRDGTASSYRDHFLVYDPDDGIQFIDKFSGGAETIDISESSYVYYGIYTDDHETWYDNGLEKSTDWPPSDNTAAEYLGLVGYATHQGAAVTGWYQHMFECPQYFPDESCDLTFKTTKDIDFTVDGQITFERAQINPDACTETALSDIVIGADRKWIDIENGEFNHLPSPVDSTSHPDAWAELTHDGTTWSSGGVSGTILKLGLDKKDHVPYYVLDGTTFTAPTDETTAYKYLSCIDSSTQQVLSVNYAVVLIDDVCYENKGVTKQELTDPIPTVDGTYAYCMDCFADATNFAWWDCSTNEVICVYGPGDGPQNYSYAWICDPSAIVLKKAYYAAATTVEPTTPIPDFLEPCQTTVIDCADLVGWPMSDNFGGNGCNSASIGGNNFDRRWNEYASSASWTDSITGGKWSGSKTGAAADLIKIQSSAFENVTGDFTLTCDFTVTHDNGALSNGMLMQVTSAGSYLYAGKRWNGSSEEMWAVKRFGSATTVASTASSGSFRIRRVGNTGYFDYDTGSGWTNLQSWTFTDTVTSIRFLMYSDNAATTQAGTYDNVVFQDGSSNEIYIDPTGEAC